MNKFSFKKGYGQVQQKDIKTIRPELMKALNINSRVSWAARLGGRVEPKVSEAEAIETVFAKYGITEIWGD